MPERFDGMTYWEMVTRQMSIVTKNKQKRFKDSKIAVLGCGGIGGLTCEMLTRMGIGELTIIDKDVFDFTNLNRQIMSNMSSLALPKSEVTKETLRLINPTVKVNAYNEEINENNVKEILKDSYIIIDCLDNIETRIITSRYAKEENIPFIHGAVNKTMGQITVFDKDTISYEEMFALPSLNKELSEPLKKEINKLSEGTPPVIGPAPNIIGCLEAMEAFKIITGIGKIIKAPKLLSFDLLNFSSFKVIEI